MHKCPATNRPTAERGPPVLEVVLLAAVTAVSLLAVLAPAAAQGPPETPAPVVASKVVVQQLNLGETFVGTVMPLRRSTVGSQVEGRVEEFLVNEGDRVTEGDPLARLRTTTLDIQLKAAEAELTLREQESDELVKSEQKEIDQAKARMESALAQTEFNDKRLKRFQDLFGRNALSSDELDEQVYAAEAASKAYEEAKLAWELATSGVWDARIAQSRARVEIQQETINRLKDDIEQHTITAPFNGYVTREHVEEGQWVTKGGPVVEVVEVDEVDVEVSVLERYMPNLRVGLEGDVEIAALEYRGPLEPFPGTVVSIVPQADLRSRSFPVKVRVKNEPREGGPAGDDVPLKPGMFARVRLPVGQRDAVTMVPKDALVLSRNQPPVVWVIAKDPAGASPPTANRVTVELGVSYGSLIEVHGLLEEGELAVVEGNERIRPGQPLAVTEKRDEG